MTLPDPDFWAGRRVLVTGHTGFKGAWLSLWLHALGAEVHGLSKGVPSSPSLYEVARVGDVVTAQEADVRDHEAVARGVAAARPEVVLHLAAQPIVRRSYERPRETYEINVMGTINVLEAVRACGGVAATVNVTSDKCYENQERERGYTEDEPMGGWDPYSSSKGASELVTAAWRRSYGMPLASGRAGNVIGGGDWGKDRLVPDMVRAASAGESLVVRNPDAVRPWQHVLNPLCGYLLLAERLAGDPTTFADAFNLGPPDTDARPVRWIADRLCELWPGEARWVHEGDGGGHEAGMLTLDSSRAGERLGWEPRWDLDEALRRIVEWSTAGDPAAVTRAQIAEYAA